MKISTWLAPLAYPMTVARGKNKVLLMFAQDREVIAPRRMKCDQGQETTK